MHFVHLIFHMDFVHLIFHIEKYLLASLIYMSDADQDGKGDEVLCLKDWLSETMRGKE